MKHLPVVLASIIGVGCLQQVRQGETLPESLRVYNEGVRWGRFTAAAGRVPPAERVDFVNRREEIAEDLRLTDYEVSSITTRSEGRATVRIKYTWYLDSIGTVHDTWADQSWMQKGKVWLLVDETRARGPAMPGLPDGDDADDADGADDADDADSRPEVSSTDAKPKLPVDDL